MSASVALPTGVAPARGWRQVVAGWRYDEGTRRDRRLDLLRGYSVFAMTVDHLDAPTWIYVVTGGNRFFVSAAEAFLFLSGLVMGMVYRPLVERQGLGAAAVKAGKRTLLLYAVTVVATLGFMWLSARLGLPWAAGLDVAEAVPEVLTLRRTFYLTDVLLLYTFLIGIAPIAFWLMHRGRTWVLLGLSWGVWAAHQIRAIDMPWPSEDGAFFYIAAWQVLFFTGLAIGWHRTALAPRVAPFLHWRTLLVSGLGLALFLALWRWGPLWAGRYVPDGGAAISEAFAKWNLPPGRLVACATVFTFFFLVVHFFWTPISGTVGRILLPLGASSLTAYVLQLLVVAALTGYRDNVAQAALDSRVRGTAFQVLGLLTVWLLLNAWVGLRHLIAHATSERALERRLDPAMGLMVAALLAVAILVRPLPVQPAAGFAPVRDDRSSVDEPYYLLHVPPNAAERQPLPALVVLPDANEDAEAFGDALIQLADRDGWLLVATQLPYEQDSLDPATVAAESPRLLRGLRDVIGELAANTGLRVRRRVTLFGYGRGAAAAERYALAYPSDVRAVALLGGGGYTLPPTGDPAAPDRSTDPPFPFGVNGMLDRFGRPVAASELRRVRFWVGVGERDRNPAETSRAWDPYLGTTRVERAEALARALRDAGAPTELRIFPDASHAVGPEMRAEVAAFAARDRESGPVQPPRLPRGEPAQRS